MRHSCNLQKSLAKVLEIFAPGPRSWIHLIRFSSRHIFPTTVAPHSSLSPSRQLHGPLLIQMLMHIERIPQQMRLMAPPLPQALKLRLVEVVLQDGPILRMRTLSDDDPGALARRQAPHVRKALLGDDDVEIVLGLVDVRAHGHDARDARGVRLGRPRRRRVHDAVFG